MVCGASDFASSYNGRMPRKSDSQRAVRRVGQDWFLPEWMKTLRVSQATLAKECDWPASTMHGIYHGRTAYYREIVNLIAAKLAIQPYELLMHPDEAMAIRRLRESALKIVQGTPPATEAPDRTGTNG